mgnify:CR=1 FL=1
MCDPHGFTPWLPVGSTAEGKGGAAPLVAFEVETGKKGVQRYLDHLETELPASGYLVGGRVTVADLNVAAALYRCNKMDFGARTGVGVHDRTGRLVGDGIRLGD